MISPYDFVQLVNVNLTIIDTDTKTQNVVAKDISGNIDNL
jgi:hypothetical protein